MKVSRIWCVWTVPFLYFKLTFHLRQLRKVSSMLYKARFIASFSDKFLLVMSSTKVDNSCSCSFIVWHMSCLNIDVAHVQFFSFDKKDVNCFGRCVASVVNDSYTKWSDPLVYISSLYMWIKLWVASICSLLHSCPHVAHTKSLLFTAAESSSSHRSLISTFSWDMGLMSNGLHTYTHIICGSMACKPDIDFQ